MIDSGTMEAVSAQTDFLDLHDKGLLLQNEGINSRIAASVQQLRMHQSFLMDDSYPDSCPNSQEVAGE